MRCARKVAGCLLFAALVWPGTLRAGPLPDDVKALYQQGAHEFKLAHYQDALADFEKVYELHHLPAVRFNIAECRRLLGEVKEAAAVYRSFIGRDPKNKHVERAQALLNQLEAVLAKQEEAQLKAPPEAPPPRGEEGTSGPPGQSDTLASESLHLVESERPIRAVAGVPSTPVAQLPPPTDAPSAPRSAIAVAGKGFAQAPPPAVHRTRIWTWVAAGSAVVVTGIAVGLGAKSNSIKSSLSSSAHPGAEVQSLQVEQVSDAHRANSFFVAGGALGVIAVTLFALDF